MKSGELHFTCLLWYVLTLLPVPSCSLTLPHFSSLSLSFSPLVNLPTPLYLSISPSLVVALHLGPAPISSPVIASSKNFLERSRGALCALLCTDDTDCSQMSWQHIHWAGGDKDVQSGARGQGDIGGREEGKKRGKDTDWADRGGKMWRESKNEGEKRGRGDVVQRSVWAKEVLTFRKTWNNQGRFSQQHQLNSSKETILVRKMSIWQLAAFV